MLLCWLYIAHGICQLLNFERCWTWKQPRCPSTDEWIKKMWCVYIYIHTHTMENYSVIKKEQNWVSCTDVDEPRAYYTAWSKSEGEKKISYINASIWSLEKWYRWKSLQDRNRGADAENGRVDRVWGKERAGWTARIALTYTHRCCCCCCC